MIVDADVPERVFLGVDDVDRRRHLAVAVAADRIQEVLDTETSEYLTVAEAFLDRTCDDWSAGVDHGALWPLKIVSTKHDVVKRAWSVVDTAFDVVGGAGIFKGNRLEQLVRDGHLGRIHPTNPMLTHELVGKMSLGVDPDEQPRWG